MPEISVLMSVYNGEEFVGQAIENILNQTYQDFELVIVDDGSTDRTYEVIQSCTDPRIRSFRFEQNRGIGAALQFGLERTRGKYIAKADADDIYVKDRLAKQKKFLDEHPDIDLVKAWISYFPHNKEAEESPRYKRLKTFREHFINQVVTTEDLSEKIYWACCIPHTTIMAKSSVMKEIGYDPGFRIGEDYKLFYEINKKGYKMATLEEVLAFVRVTFTSTTSTLKSEVELTDFKIKEKEIVGLFESGQRVFLWGAGGKGRNLVERVLQDRGLRIFGFIDSDPLKQQEELLGCSIYSPDVLEKGDKVIITSEPGLYQIGEELKRMGYKNVVDFIGFA